MSPSPPDEQTASPFHPVAAPPVGRWGAVGLVVALSFFAVTAFLSYRNHLRFARTEELAAASRVAIVEVSEIISLLEAAETAQRAYLATEDESFRSTYEETSARVPDGLAALRKTSAAGDRWTSMADLLDAASQRLDHLRGTIQIRDDRGFDVARTEIRSRRGHDLMDQVRRQANAFRRSETELLAIRDAEAARTLRFTHLSDLLMATLGLSLAAGAFVRLRREFLARHAAARDLEGQRELLQVTLHGLAEAVVTTDREGNIVSLNAAAERLLGRASGEAVGGPAGTVLRVIDERTRTEVETALVCSLRTGRAARQARHSLLVTRDGTERRIDGNAAPIRTPDGRTLGAVLTFRDVTDRKRAEEALRRSEERLRQALRAARAVAWEIDVRAEMVIRSDNAADLLGLPTFGTIAEHLDSVDPEDREAVGTALAAALRGEAEYAAEYRVVLPSGRKAWIVDRGEVRCGGQGRPAQLVGAFIDVTDRRQAEEALLQADRRKDQFLATLAHELRNPLAPVSNALQAWPFVKGDPAEMDRLRETMARQVRQMTRLIDDLLDVSRITRGKITLRKEPTNVKAVLDAAVDGARPLVSAKGQRLKVFIPEPVQDLDGDSARLVQVFSNLLQNASKYTDDGGCIEVESWIDRGQVVVSVKDDGAGIPPDMLGRVFELFAQADQTLDRSHGGLGIGLTLVKTLVELHGGSVEAKSDGPGRGSVFLVRLPAAEFASPSPPATLPDAVAAVAPHRVLVVDDMRPSARTLAILLQGIGQEARIAHDGPAGLAALEEFEADVVLLDIAMPGMDGYEACRRIRKRFADSATRPLLVALTGYGAEEDRRRAFEAGFDRHLIKPVSLDALKELLRGSDVPGTDGTGESSAQILMPASQSALF